MALFIKSAGLFIKSTGLFLNKSGQGVLGGQKFEGFWKPVLWGVDSGSVGVPPDDQWQLFTGDLIRSLVPSGSWL